MSPDKPGDKTYSELVSALSKHYKPAPSEIVERFKFHSRSRKPGESVATFVAELRSLAEFCNFNDTLEVMLRDRIVCGINDDALQKRLLSEPDLDYAKAVQTALNMETAVQSIRELKNGPQGPATSVHRTGASPVERGSSDPSPTCFRCGGRGHVVAQCRVDKNVVCHKCGKRVTYSESVGARRNRPSRVRPTERQSERLRIGDLERLGVWGMMRRKRMRRMVKRREK